MDRAIKIEAGSEVIEYTYDDMDILTKVSNNGRDTTFTYNEYILI